MTGFDQVTDPKQTLLIVMLRRLRRPTPPVRFFRNPSVSGSIGLPIQKRADSISFLDALLALGSILI